MASSVKAFVKRTIEHPDHDVHTITADEWILKHAKNPKQRVSRPPRPSAWNSFLMAVCRLSTTLRVYFLSSDGSGGIVSDPPVIF